MTTTTIKPSTILRAAARLIEERGLACGTFKDEDGRVCALEALIEASPTETDGEFNLARRALRSVEFNLARSALRSVVGPHIAKWSDAAARAGTPSTVIDGLRRAAELAESEGG